MAYYVDTMQSLLLSDTVETYNAELLTLTTKWSQPFTTYFLATVHARIDHLGSWRQRKFDVELATTNTSESFNAQLKKLQNWTDAPVDTMALVLCRLSSFYVTEITRGRAGLNDYILRDGLAPQPLSGKYCYNVTH